MSLSGNLSTMSLPDILQWLNSARKSGTVSFHQGPHVKRIHFSDGEISSSSSNDPTEYLGQFLLSHRIISEENLQKGMEIQKETGVMLGKILLAEEYLTEDDLRRYLVLKTEETIFSIFLWEDARFDFIQELSGQNQLISVHLSISDVLLKGLSRYDELQRIKKVFGTFATVVGRTETEPGPEFLSNPRRAAIWEGIDGKRSIAEVALEVHTADFLACEVMHLLLNLKHVQIVRRVSFEDLDDGPATANLDNPLELARQRAKEGKLEQALDLVDAASRSAQAVELEDLRQKLQQTIVDGAYQEDLPPDKVPYLLKPVEALTGESLTPQEAFLLSRINGTWDIQSVVTVAPFSELEVIRTLKSLRIKEIIGLR